MNDNFKQLQQDYTDLEANLALQLPFFRSKGNCYLLSDNNLKSEQLLYTYQRDCKGELSFNQTKTLKRFISLYRSLLATLALETDFDLNDPVLKQALDQNIVLANGDNIIEQFSLLRQQCQRLLTYYYSFVLASYSLHQAPVVTIQTELLRNLGNFDLNSLEVDLFIDWQGAKTDGKPDLLKIKNQEAAIHKLKIEISSQSELLAALSYLEEQLPEEMGYEIVYEAVIQALNDIYTEIYNFYYQQLFTNRLQLAEAANNIKLKFPEPNKLIIAKCIELFKTAESTMQADDREALSKLANSFLIKLNKLATNYNFFDPTRAKLYNLIFRLPSEFEQTVFTPFFSLDCQLLSLDPAENGIIISSFVAVNAPKLYTYAAILICGTGYNKAWGEKALEPVNFNLIDKFIDHADKLDRAAQANYQIEREATNIILGNI